MKISQALETYRRHTGKTYKEIAEELGTDTRTLYRWKAGTSEPNRGSKAARALLEKAEALGPAPEEPQEEERQKGDRKPRRVYMLIIGEPGAFKWLALYASRRTAEKKADYLTGKGQPAEVWTFRRPGKGSKYAIIARRKANAEPAKAAKAGEIEAEILAGLLEDAKEPQE